MRTFRNRRGRAMQRETRKAPPIPKPKLESADLTNKQYPPPGQLWGRAVWCWAPPHDGGAQHRLCTPTRPSSRRQVVRRISEPLCRILRQPPESSRSSRSTSPRSVRYPTGDVQRELSIRETVLIASRTAGKAVEAGSMTSKCPVPGNLVNVISRPPPAIARSWKRWLIWKGT